MPDDETVDEQHEDETEEQETGGDRQLAGAAAASALAKERKARKDLEKQIKDLLREKQERDEAELSENERLKGQLARLQADAEDRDRRDAERDRERLVIRAAKDFADPDEVLAILAHRGELEGIETEKDAERVLKALEKAKPHLLRKQSEAMPDTSRLDSVLLNGEEPGRVTDPTAKSIIAGNDLLAMTEEQQQELKRTNPALYRRSLEALGSAETTHSVTVHR